MRISNYFDKDLNEQVFMVRGDEAYARSTKTLLELGNVTTHELSYDLSVWVNVLRDKGDGSITIYDNDEPIYVTNEWDSTLEGMTIQLSDLNYDMTHNIYARYMGNNQCSPSKSETLQKCVENTNRGTATLTITDATTQYDPNTENVVKTITLTSTLQDQSFLHEQNIVVEYDGTAYYLQTPYDSNSVTVTIPNIGDIGKHTLTASYEGSRYLTSATTKQDISVGYIIEAYDVPSVVYYGTSNMFYAKVTGANGEPTYNVEVELIEDGTALTSGYTSVLGIAICEYPEPIKATTRMDIKPRNFKVTINGQEYNAPFTTKAVFINEEDITLQFSDILVKNRPIIFTPIAPYKVPIKISGGLFSEEITVTAQTPLTVTGNGIKSKIFTVTAGGTTKSATRADFIQYWSLSNQEMINSNYYSGVMLYQLNNYYRMIIPPASTIIPFAIKDEVRGFDYKLEIELITTSGDIFLGNPSNMQIDEDNNITPQGSSSVSYFRRRFSNDNLQLIRENGVTSLYLNDSAEPMSSYSNQEASDPILFLNNPSQPTQSSSAQSVNFDFKALKFRRL